MRRLSCDRQVRAGCRQSVRYRAHSGCRRPSTTGTTASAGPPRRSIRRTRSPERNGRSHASRACCPSGHTARPPARPDSGPAPGCQSAAARSPSARRQRHPPPAPPPRRTPGPGPRCAPGGLPRQREILLGTPHPAAEAPASISAHMHSLPGDGIPGPCPGNPLMHGLGATVDFPAGPLALFACHSPLLGGI